MPAVNQVEFSPYLFDLEFVNYSKSHKISLQAYTPLVRGKKFKDPRLIQLAEKYQRSPAQIILRWNVQQGISPIPKATSSERIRENFNIFDFDEYL
jgi:diketogulonate reductase-like aldo/keto reductase